MNLAHETFDDLNGVYVIWNSESGRVVRLGSGVIRDRLSKHRVDKVISKYKSLSVSWAKVHALQMEGVEAYLSDEYEPLIGERFPDRTRIKVNLI